MAKVAIITRTKNRPILLRRALESVKSQVYRDYVWVIVNDGGAVNPIEEIVLEAQKAGLETVLIHNEASQGMEAASNKGIRHSQSDYIVVHDDDDSWEQGFLSETVNYLESNDGKLYGGVVTHAYKVEEVLEGDTCTINAKTIFKTSDTPLFQIYLSDIAKLNLFPNNSFLYKREWYEKIGGYNEQLPVLGDWDFNLRFLLVADIAVIPKPLANYHYRIQNAIKEEYANTVVHGVDEHLRYDVILRNHLLREDINNNRVGLGYLANIGRDLNKIATENRGYNLDLTCKVNNLNKFTENIASSVVEDITRVIKKHGFWGMVKKTAGSLVRFKDK